MRGIDGEIIVVDNSSQDHSCGMVKTDFSRVNLICNTENVGFSKANNLGIKQAKGKYILLLNPDTVIAENTLQKVLQFAENKPRFGAIGVKMIDGSGNFLPESKRNIPTPIVSLKKMLGNSNSYYAQHLMADESGKANILAGAVMFMELAKYQEVGGLDDDYFMFGEDIDLSYKLLLKGYENYYFSGTTIIHYKGESTAKDEKYLRHFYGAMLIFYRKHFAKHSVFTWLMPISIKFWQLFRQLQLKRSRPEEKQKYHSLLYIGSENDTLILLQNYFSTAKVNVFAQCSTRVISVYDELAKIKILIDEQHIEAIIFDADTVEYYKIIFWMQELAKSHNLLFYNKLPQQKVWVGSYHKEFKGEIIQL